MELTNKYIVIKHHIEDAPKESHFEVKLEAIRLSLEPGSDDVIVKNLYISIDPYLINRMKSYSASHNAISFATPLIPGQAIDALVIGKVIASGNAKFEKDDVVIGVFTWAEYSVVALLKEKLGFDDAFNYKEETDLNSTLKRYFPDGIDIYFDNVGGKMLEAAVDNMKAFGRVSVCGVISEYTNAENKASPNMLNLVYKRISIRGFLAADFMNVFGDFTAKTLDYIRDGQLQVIEDRSLGVESIPSAFVGLFNGDNVGKKVVVLADE
ncbi:hypothetical protein TSUD_181750 [Trifolium subterraneum]|uniref:Enoyl reductase (ER) domain-containing protein n=1 Tax=Trifolium subterraneum TaxID=3900 RepID=A0A2Z6NZ29_TRISU|nr:hypothetical protein TSUD_181750 [Trifolium subterraneum]